MFEVISNFFKKLTKTQKQEDNSSKDTAKERLQLVLMQDRANVSVEFLEMMKQEIIDVIKKYIVVDEGAIDVRLTNQPNSDGTTGAPSLYANIPILNIKNDVKGEKMREAEEMKKDTNASETTKSTLVENKEIKEEKKEEKEQEIKESVNEKIEEKDGTGEVKEKIEEIKGEDKSKENDSKNDSENNEKTEEDNKDNEENK